MLDFAHMEATFRSNHNLEIEDNVKINFYGDIAKPILEEVNPSKINSFQSEYRALNSGRADAAFENLRFEYKSKGKFNTEAGISEALKGRNNTSDHGLYHYLVGATGAEELKNQDKESFVSLIQKNYGIGFDGNKFLFARFVKTAHSEKFDTENTILKSEQHLELPLRFECEETDFQTGLRRLAILFRQQDKTALTKENLIKVFNPKNSIVRDSIYNLYKQLVSSTDKASETYSSRVDTLYNEWDAVFGKVYGDPAEQTGFTTIIPALKEMYMLADAEEIDYKKYLFGMQTFFNIFLKLLVNYFLSQQINPSFTVSKELSRAEMIELFEGVNEAQNTFVQNFFEIHYLEWFTFAESTGEDLNVVNTVLKELDNFDTSTFVLKPESLQDILQEAYMGLIPKEFRHIMGEYFSPDWVVEHTVDISGYSGALDEKLIDPCCGSGSFITHALKKTVNNHQAVDYRYLQKVTENIVGIDINPISVVAAKANYIFSIFSVYFRDNSGNRFSEPLEIPVYCADSVLAPIVYSEENTSNILVKTHVGDFVLPKFVSIKAAHDFLTELSKSFDEKKITNQLKIFLGIVEGKNLIDSSSRELVKQLYSQIFSLHRAGKDSFWPQILKNSFAPVLLAQKFDYVVGNPPWISWKSMSKTYREGTLKVWQSYGIFEKNAYDKKTTHDDFGMAVTYVAIDQYLDDHGTLAFLLPASFLKSTKGGEGFRKLRITRNGQNVPFAIDRVEDFSAVNLFTTNTSLIRIKKNQEMTFPMEEYVMWEQERPRKAIDSHADWSHARKLFSQKVLHAQPVDKNSLNSAWSTLDKNTIAFADKVLDVSSDRYYKGRKGIEPAGAKGVFVLKNIRADEYSDFIHATNDQSRGRREDIKLCGEIQGRLEQDHIYPMLGGRNIERWRVKDHTYMLVPHDSDNKYGIPENDLASKAPRTYRWLENFETPLFDSRVQNGKFFNKDLHPFYRLDNVGEYSFAKYKVLWKEQSSSLAAVFVSTYKESIPNYSDSLFSQDKEIMVDSKVLMLAVSSANEGYYVTGILNSLAIRSIVDSYAIGTNRGTDVLSYVQIPKFDASNPVHLEIAGISEKIHSQAKEKKSNCFNGIAALEATLNKAVKKIYQ